MTHNFEQGWLVDRTGRSSAIVVTVIDVLTTGRR